MTRSITKKMSVIYGVALLSVFFAGTLNAQTYRKPGLLIISHGSSSVAVNAKVEEMVESVRKENASKKTFFAVENAFLEVGTPTAKTGVARLQAAGCDMIVVVPFFTSQDGHTLDDIPVVMGLSSDKEVLAELKEEGIELAAPTVPVIITQTLNETDLLADFLTSETGKLSTKAKEEAIVVISLEKNEYKDIVVPTIAKAVKAAAKANGIKTYGDVYSWQDETFWTNVMPTVKEFSKNNKKVLVISVYTTRSAKSLYENAYKAAQAKSINVTEGFGDGQIVYSEASLIDFADTPKVLLNAAQKALK